MTVFVTDPDFDLLNLIGNHIVTNGNRSGKSSSLFQGPIFQHACSLQFVRRRFGRFLWNFVGHPRCWGPAI